ncbi:class I SAM-dependent methyltransferase [Paenibacillus sacheonensis]|uniref:Methyltransferase domain-containing protein n=1 Tax=Paenibacillus sacheonensis TaxID=742054 RepID=A0A7X5BZ05_9BACL|nr:methyltransferase domain-containing protein [Paenibacillus sacheonensis]MBM7563930.1 2-polyprenyl-3-methyl-5-hydroxy-6-metoxy-1,4-benzoquinol methylase [Paenibacillus sacheonensis]NBC67725.1 methyltransferase domain-containing protein [Paenibacillus sacheonensis]
MNFDYISYWENNYKEGGTSGRGSFGDLAAFKAEVVNAIIAQYGVRRVMEFGCGDGHQLSLMHYPQYLGLDISPTAVQLCAEKNGDDPSKSFMLYRPGAFQNRGFVEADMTVCLDVLYHITDEADYRATLRDLFSPKPRVVVLYTRLTRGSEPRVVETIQDRDIFHYLAEFGNYYVHEIIPQRYKEQSSADFIVLRRGAD